MHRATLSPTLGLVTASNPVTEPKSDALASIDLGALLTATLPFKKSEMHPSRILYKLFMNLLFEF